MKYSSPQFSKISKKKSQYNRNNKNNNQNNENLTNLNSVHDINNKKEKEYCISPRILKILSNYSSKEKDMFLQTLKKHKKITEEFIPKENILRPNKVIKKNNTNKEFDKNMINKENKELVPIRYRIIKINKKIEKNKKIIQSLSEENKLFSDNFKLTSVMWKKKMSGPKMIELENYFTDNNNNIFNKSIILSNENQKMNKFLMGTDIKECKEDYNIIESLKKFNEGKNIKNINNIDYPIFLYNKIKKEKKKKKINIHEIKKEIEETKNTIANLNSFDDDFDTDKDSRKNIELLKKKFNQIKINEGNKKDNIYNNSSPDINGTYKLVTKCNINSRNDYYNSEKRKKKRDSSFNNLYNFFNEYNTIKKLLGPTIKSKNISYNYQKLNKITNKKRYNLYKKTPFTPLCLSFDTNNNDISSDINKLYDYIKSSNFEKANYLFSDYIKKYNKQYNLNFNKQDGIEIYPIINDVKRNLKYNICNKMINLNRSKYIDLNLFKNGKRQLSLNKIKAYDEKIKSLGFDLSDYILGLHHDKN